MTQYEVRPSGGGWAVFALRKDGDHDNLAVFAEEWRARQLRLWLVASELDKTAPNASKDPFGLQGPNETTLASMRDAEAGDTVKASSFNAMIGLLDAPEFQPATEYYGGQDGEGDVVGLKEWREDNSHEYEGRRFGVQTNRDEDLWFYVGKYNLTVETAVPGAYEWLQVSIPLAQARNILEAVVERIEEQELA